MKQIRDKKLQKEIKEVKLNEIRNEKETIKKNLKLKKKEISLIIESFKEKECEIKSEELRMKETENKLNALRLKLNQTNHDLKIYRDQRDQKVKQNQEQLLCFMFPYFPFFENVKQRVLSKNNKKQKRI